MIRCGHCGGLHASVREVRSCSGPTVEAAGAVVASVSRGERSDPVAPVRSALVLAGHHGNVAGPEELGRNLVVRAGASSVPAAWAAAPRIVIDAAVLNDPASTLAALRARWLARQRTVIELATTFDEPPVATEHRPLWKISPTFAFELDELWHLVWSNSVDGRTGNPVWRWACEAVALGARAQGAGDVVLPDGTVAVPGPSGQTADIAPRDPPLRSITDARSGIDLPAGTKLIIVRGHTSGGAPLARELTIDLNLERGPGFTVEHTY